MRQYTRVALAAITLGAALAGCGAPSAPGPTSPGTSSNSPPRAWDEQPPAERLATMNERVTPRMRALFVAHDPHRYAKFSCAACHGKRGPEHAYRMPNPELLLEPTAWNTTPAPEPSRAPSEMDAFMARVVAPEMTHLLGRAPSTSTCFICHTREE